MAKPALAVTEPRIADPVDVGPNTDIATSIDDDRRNYQIFLRHTKHGETQVALAKEFGLSQPTVSRICASFDDTREIAKAYLNNHAITFAKRVKKSANVDESLEVLDRTDVLPKKERGAGAHTGVNVWVNMPGQERSKPPIELSQGNVIANYQTQTESEGVTAQPLTASAETTFAGETGGRKSLGQAKADSV